MTTISIIGGDRRHVFLADFFIKAGLAVTTYGLPPYLLNPKCHVASSLGEAMKGHSHIVTGIPLSRDGKNLTTMEPFHIGLMDFLSHLTAEHTLYTGVLHYLATDHCDKNQIPCYDLMADNQIAILNAVATAEGAIMKAIEKSTITLHQHRCLVLGYGRCGRILADKLKGMDAKVTICARDPEALAYADAGGFDTENIASLSAHVSDYDFIFNTIPYLILTNDLLKKTAPEVVVIDIASHPGGVDYNAAKELGINATLYLGIPGKTAPKTSSCILGGKILSLMEEEPAILRASSLP